MDWLPVVSLIVQGAVLVVLLVAIRTFGKYVKEHGRHSQMMADALRAEVSMHEAVVLLTKKILAGRREV